jgi:hypothetical protein
MRSIIAVLFLTTPAFALNEPVLWRDPDTSCAYWLTPQGGIAPRYRRDGIPDCPGTNEAARDTTAPSSADQSTSQLGRGYDALKREIERLGERLGR